MKRYKQCEKKKVLGMNEISRTYPVFSLHLKTTHFCKNMLQKFQYSAVVTHYSRGRKLSLLETSAS